MSLSEPSRDIMLSERDFVFRGWLDGRGDGRIDGVLTFLDGP